MTWALGVTNAITESLGAHWVYLSISIAAITMLAVAITTFKDK